MDQLSYGKHLQALHPLLKTLFLNLISDFVDSIQEHYGIQEILVSNELLTSFDEAREERKIKD